MLCQANSRLARIRLTVRDVGDELVRNAERGDSHVGDDGGIAAWAPADLLWIAYRNRMDLQRERWLPNR